MSKIEQIPWPYEEDVRTVWTMHREDLQKMRDLA
jgi:hypothetical protein